MCTNGFPKHTTIEKHGKMVLGNASALWGSASEQVCDTSPDNAPSHKSHINVKHFTREDSTNKKLQLLSDTISPILFLSEVEATEMATYT
jgi:hypothetical protein